VLLSSGGLDEVDSASAASRGKRWRRADTNIVEVSFRQLTAPSNMHTGDPVYCDECKAVLSVVSKVEQNGDEQVGSHVYNITQGNGNTCLVLWAEGRTYICCLAASDW